MSFLKKLLHYISQGKVREPILLVTSQLWGKRRSWSTWTWLPKPGLHDSVINAMKSQCCKLTEKCKSFGFWKFPPKLSNVTWLVQLPSAHRHDGERAGYSLKEFLEVQPPIPAPLAYNEFTFQELAARQDRFHCRGQCVTGNDTLGLWSLESVWDVLGCQLGCSWNKDNSWKEAIEKIQYFLKNTWSCLSVDADFIHHGCLAV